ncbi:MAG: hypothetical protein KAJ07_00795 [Planctomycetes bacterium]|nr:hypothetical protein [Planctomycetota bacterium]
MMRNRLFSTLFVLSLVLVTSAYASTVWDPATNGITPPAVGNWNVAANWTNGLPSVVVDGKAQFFKVGAAECRVTDAQSCVFFVQGDNNVGGVIRVMSGGSITTGTVWSAVGYNNSAHMIVEVGGSLTFGGHMRIGLLSGAAGILDINGGTVNATGDVTLGGTGCTGHVNINGGTLNLDHWDYPGSINDGVIDIRTGSVNIINDGDQSANALNFYNDGKITAFGGDGILNIVYVGGVTTITALPAGETDPPTPNPASFSSVPTAISSTVITMTATEGSDVSGPIEYLFDVTSSDPGAIGSGWQTDNTFTATDLLPSTMYTYTVKMRDYFGTEGTASGGTSATTWSAIMTTIVWNPAGNGITPPATGDWSNPSNWTPSLGPDGNFKAVFNVTNAAEAVVNGSQIFNQLLQGSGGPGGVIRIVDGGSLTSTSAWFSIGQNNTARFIVEEGGVADFAGHAWFGMNDGADAIVEINGGTFTVSGGFGLGYHDSAPSSGIATANIYVNSGSFNMDRFTGGVESIQPGSGIDIREGSFIINGDDTVYVADFVASGKITAYGGTGRVLYDYNATNPGKTTIRGLEGVEGDIDEDYDVDIDDMSMFVQEWLGGLPIEGAVAYWRLDETAGAVAVDASGNGYDGTLMNMDDNDWVAGVNGNGLNFDGADDYVTTGSLFAGMAGTDLTISAWVKALAVNPATQFIISINTSTGDNRLLCGTQPGSDTFSLGDTAWHDTATTVIDNTWHHIAYVLDDSADTITVYVDGSEALSFASTVSVAADDILSLGQEYDPGMTTGDFYKGQLDDVRVYGRALGAAEIARLDSDCSCGANFAGAGDCMVDLQDYAVLASNWLEGYSTYWHVAETVYPTDDYVITPHWAEDFGIVGDGVTDVTDAIQTALVSIGNLGGGALYLPAGNYKVSGNLTVPSRVTLRGDWQKPVPGSPIVGTIIQAYAGRGDVDAVPFIELSGSSGVRDIAIWYPEQDPTDIQPYPPTLHGGGVTLENVTLVNPYFGFTTYLDGTTACPFVRGVYGTPLYMGTEYDRLADIGRIETVHFSPDFWAGSGLPGAPTAGEHEDWIYNNGTGMLVRRIDWSYSCYVTVEGYSIGLALRPTRWSEDSSTPNGQSYGFELIGCKTGIYIEQSAGAGYQFTRFNIDGAETGVYLGPVTAATNMFHTCTINASGDAVFSEGSAKVMMMSCDIEQGTLDFDGGYLSVINSNFTSTTTNHIEVGSGVYGASILGNSFSGGARIVDSTTYPVHIDHTALAVDPLPAYDYKKPATVYKPAKADLFVVTKSPYNAQGDGVTDDTAAFQTALAAADANGGGTVFVPGGNYRLDGNLIIPTGVELRGVFDVAHGTSVKGSLLNVYGGRGDANGTPFIQIEPNAGIKGLTFHYPEQIYDEFDNDPVTGMYGMEPYPFLIRGLGSDVYVLNIAATIPYQILDLATYRCDRHYIDYVKTTALKTGIHVGNGSTDGQIHNCQFNPSLYTHQGGYYESIPYNTSDNIHKILWRDSTAYLFGNVSGEVLHENFVFGGMKGMHLIEEGGFGPSGYCMGMGVDACTNALQIDNIGAGGLDMINSQIVTTDSISGRYLEVGDPFDDTFRMFCSSAWGGEQYAAVIKGGDVRLQLFHVNREPTGGAFMVNNDASLQNLGGSFTDKLEAGQLFLTIDSTATAEFIGNVINVVGDTDMPDDTEPNITATGNLRVQ